MSTSTIPITTDPIICNNFLTELQNAQTIIGLDTTKANILPHLSPTDPAFFFFSEANLSPSLKLLLLSSTYLLQLSQLLYEDIYKKNETCTESKYLMWLKENSNCLTDFMRQFCIPNSEFICDQNLRYRTIDGTCNNFKYPKTGSANSPYGSILQPIYHDQIYDIRKSVNGVYDLPNPREIVNTFYMHPKGKEIKISPNLGAVMFGQFITHDVGSRTNVQSRPTGGPGIKCCSYNYNRVLSKSLSHPACAPIEIPKYDKYFGNKHIGCMNNIRSQVVVDNDCKLTQAQQINQVSSLLDLSNIYSNSAETLNTLRLFKSGELRNNANSVFPTLLNCNRPICYQTGDIRALQTASLAGIHSLFLREHNKIARILAAINWNWDDNRLFEEARRINIAQYQHIVYNEWLPTIFGESFYERSVNEKWSEDIDTRNSNEFSAAAFRNLHLLIPENFTYFDNDGKITTNISLSDSIGQVLILETQYDDVVRGLLYQPIKLNGYHYEIANLLFKNSNNIGIDLLSTDIERGRDHGIEPYLKYRKICGLKPVDNFKDLYPSISQKNIDKLSKIYSDVYDIDLLVGANLEKTNRILGPTLECIIKDQFYRLKYGDKFFYNNPYSRNPFNELQLKEIQKITWARILCDNTNTISGLPKNSFLSKDIIDCAEIPSVNLGLWAEKN